MKKFLNPGSLSLLQPDIMARAVRTFDRASGVVVIAIWLAAATFMTLAYVSVGQTVAARQQMVAALAAQPVLPEIKQEPVPATQIDSYVDRVVKRYGGKVTITNSAGELRITAGTADAFNVWMSALGYLDAIAPDISWTIKELCVGAECKDGLMAARLTAQRIVFSTPAPAS